MISLNKVSREHIKIANIKCTNTSTIQWKIELCHTVSYLFTLSSMDVYVGSKLAQARSLTEKIHPLLSTSPVEIPHLSSVANSPKIRPHNVNYQTNM
jgi:hypothetical protein